MKKTISAAMVILIGLICTVSAREPEPVNVDSRGLALRGYDPVAYFTEEKAVPGVEGIEAEHGGAVYRFAGAANREKFLENPEAYLPEYGGYCAWAVSRGISAGINPEAWTIQDGRLFLNFNRGTHRRFQKNIDENIEKADENWPKVKSRL